jgi:solute carrier family 44 (choline transporter-like protein), member 2/4/5
MAKRKCTDILCLLIFLASCGGIAYIGDYAMKNGDPSLILAPMDAEGNFCGRTAGYEAYPMVWYQNLNLISWLPYAVCVKSCPTASDTLVACMPTAQTDPVPVNN